MGQVYLIDLAGQQARWLGLRQSAIAGNISNISTPGYRAIDARPFEDVLSRSAIDMTRSSESHFSADLSSVRSRFKSQSDPWETSISGNSVNVEEQLMKAGEVTRGFALNTGVVRSFHRMMLSALKG